MLQACILDFVRCSITFDTSEEMFDGINKFMQFVSQKQAKCVIKVLRLKNSFKHVLKWNDKSDSQYCDIKLNVLVSGAGTKKSTSKVCMISGQFRVHQKLLNMCAYIFI